MSAFLWLILAMFSIGAAFAVFLICWLVVDTMRGGRS